MTEIRRETVSLDNGTVYKSLPYFSPCIIDVILIAEGRMRDSSIVCGFKFFPIKYETSKDARKDFSGIVVYVFINTV